MVDFPIRHYAVGWVVEPRTADGRRVFHEYLDADNDEAAIAAGNALLDREIEKLEPGAAIIGAVFNEKRQLALLPRKERVCA